MDTSGIEPEASSMPRKRSTPDLRALKRSTIMVDIRYKSIGRRRPPGTKRHVSSPTPENARTRERRSSTLTFSTTAAMSPSQRREQ